MLAEWENFVAARLGELWLRTGEHLFLTGVATGIAVLLGIPLGILGSRVRWLRSPLTAALGVFQTIPSLAMLAILLSLLGKIGALPAIIALTLYALLPIVRNTLTGLVGVSSETIEAARGVGMTTSQRLRLVRIPLALPVIVAGIRTAAVISVGIATLSAFIGAGGLGQFINRGLGMNNTRLILLGAVPAAALALLVDFTIWAAEWGLRPVRQKQRGMLKARLRPVALAAPALLVAFGIVTSLTKPMPFSDQPGAVAEPIRIG
ncbi:MAG: ABC transporter permease, partial [Phycisphaerae bacterium]